MPTFHLKPLGENGLEGRGQLTALPGQWPVHRLEYGPNHINLLGLCVLASKQTEQVKLADNRMATQCQLLLIDARAHHHQSPGQTLTATACKSQTSAFGLARSGCLLQGPWQPLAPARLTLATYTNFLPLHGIQMRQ